ncbi:hybrid sensor histidine kinase/response regulator transcription factor [Cyclobacterium salsum]|uniref:hybrid sensor histidine kinase/response regulator transcription factor n=1 Tax=Cyclobacterium salsum TaxID=2666329 RepID=UPI001391E5F9|nr:ATP-binding protein [Cyclobacterium salsum]
MICLIFKYCRVRSKKTFFGATGFVPILFLTGVAVHRLPLICLLWFFLYCHKSEAAVTDSTILKRSQVGLNPIILDQHWKFHPGDDPSWAAPDFDDSDWSAIDPTTDIHYLTDLRAAEIGWFRLRLGVDTSLLNTPLAMTIFQRGASEIYLNGKLIHKLGVVSQDPNKEVIFNPNLTPYSFQFEDKPHQVLAVRFSFTKRNPYMNFLGLWGGNPALIIQLNQMDKAIQGMVQTRAVSTSRLVGKATFLLFLGLLHLFFFVTYPSNKTNLYYSLFTSSLALGYFLEHVFRFMPREGDSYFVIGLISCLFFSTYIIWGILAVYSFAREKLDGLFWFATVSALLFIPSWKWPYEAANYYWPYFLLSGPMVAVLVSRRAVRKEIKGAWIVFLGWSGNFLFWSLFCLFFFNILPRVPYDIAVTLDLAVFCAAISFSVLLAIEYAQTKRTLQTSLLDMEVKRLETQKMRELDKTKSEFFTNISHEFRTPLTLITGTVDQLEGVRNGHPLLQDGHSLIKRNAARLLQLVSQLLDLSKLEAGKLTLEKEPGEIVGFAKRLAGTFSSQFESKQIAFSSSYPEGPIYLQFDPDKLEKVLSNLLINAYKFTPTSGNVRFDVSCLAETDAGPRLQFEVTDSGIGIPPERLPFIFDRFYQGEASATRSYEGTGIGLALVRELTELQGGTIRVESSPDSGTCFTVELTLERVEPGAIPGLKQSESALDTAWIPQETNPAGKRSLDQLAIRTTVLIVEDNPELRHFLAQSLQNQYRILEAENGLMGFNIAATTVPDLIISDVMMPVMDGISLSEKVKNDERTSHIPFVLLTARADSDSKIGGLDTGADAYLTKPFDMKELRVRIHHLIEGRKKLRERFSRSLDLKTSEIAVTSTDEKFLKKAMAILEENLANTDFDVVFFSREIGMSRTNLHRKLKALTDCSATEFIRAVRLKRAMYLLEQKSGNVTEVAYAVGFNSVSYFDKCFKKQFGKTPSGIIS